MDNQTPNQAPPPAPLPQAPPVPQSQPTQSPPSGNIFIPLKVLLTILVVLTILAVGTGAYAVLNSKSAKPIPSLTPSPTSSPTPSLTPTPSAASQSAEILFAENLNSCVKFKTNFVHLLTKETFEKEILGIIDGKCNYVEQMPNGGKMECKYTEDERKTVAQYYKDVASANSFGTKIGTDLSTGKTKTTYIINGKQVENPLDEALKSGACVVSGY